jgi:hypothetical protein
MVNIVKKAKKPKYCAKVNMFSGNFEFLTKVKYICLKTNKYEENIFLTL